MRLACEISLYQPAVSCASLASKMWFRSLFYEKIKIKQKPDAYSFD
jgi:hypothetical protein